jgi:SAM-dependent methyltransferase
MPGWRRAGLAEFTGERVIPDQVDADLLNEHLARYAFAARSAVGKRVLDAGCGAGYGSAELAKWAISVVGVDLAGEAISYAREHYRLPQLHFERGSCSALPHPDASFDLVVGFEVIEHLEGWRAFLTEANRVLAPGGQFIVSTPNRLYYTESRGGMHNPFHVHEFSYGEFRDALAEVFPYISLFVENHVEGVVFQPVENGETAQVRVDGRDVDPADSHFFVAVCAPGPQKGGPTFVYVPSAANLLRERGRHIELLEGELAAKNAWLAELKHDHQRLVDLFRSQQEELEARNRWAQDLNRKLDERGARILELQEENARTAEGYRAKVAELEQESRAASEWAIDTSRKLEEKILELGQCVEYLHATEQTVTERTEWAQGLERQVQELDRQVAMVRASRWVALGRTIGLGPRLPAS